MYCEHCGAKNEDNAKFCEVCGKAIEAEEVVIQGAQPQNQFQQGDIATQTKPQTTTAYPQPNYEFNIPAVTKPKKPISTKQKVIMALIGVVVILCIAFFVVGNMMNKPDNIVKDFFNSTTSYDYSKAYDCLDITSGEFTSKEMYIKMMEASTNNIPKKEILNYVIKETSSNSNSSGLISDSSNKNSLMKYYTVEYTEKGSSSSKTMSVILTKQSSKSWLFFDTYKVAVEDIVAETYDIYVPSGAKLSFDGTEIASSYIVAADNSTSSSYDGYDNYKLTNVFAGSHSIKVSAEYMEEYEKEINVVDGGSSQITDIKVPENAINDMSKMAEKLLNAVYSAAIEGKKFDAIKEYLTTDAEALRSMESKYTSISSKARKEDGTGLVEIGFSDFKVNSTDTKRASSMTFELEANFKYSYKYTSRSYWDETINEYTSSSPQSGSLDFYFIYENGKWLVRSFSFNVYYY